MPVHLHAEDGSWVATDVDWSQQPDWWAGGHGLYSTPRDYLRFQRMLLGRGTLDGAQILQPETVDAAFTNQIGEIDFPPEIKTADPGSTADFNGGPGLKWGLGLLLNTEAMPGMRAAGSGSWAGHLQHPLLGRPEDRGHGRDLLADAAVRGTRGLPGLHRLRTGAVRLALGVGLHVHEHGCRLAGARVVILDRLGLAARQQQRDDDRGTISATAHQ